MKENKIKKTKKNKRRKKEVQEQNKLKKNKTNLREILIARFLESRSARTKKKNKIK